MRRVRGTAFCGQLRGGFRQHRRLHVVGGTQTEGVAVALGRGDGVGQRLRRQEEDFLLVGEVTDGKTDVGQECADQYRDVLARYQLVGGGLRVRRLAAIVLRDDNEFLAVDAAARIDL